MAQSSSSLDAYLSIGVIQSLEERSLKLRQKLLQHHTYLQNTYNKVYTTWQTRLSQLITSVLQYSVLHGTGLSQLITSVQQYSVYYMKQDCLS